ncbi:MAG: hypothetical protein KBG15_17955 [Kofleriaceae bacterium]|nr:hypothetical protein [Kofleriaceae bacterium]
MKQLQEDGRQRLLRVNQWVAMSSLGAAFCAMPLARTMHGPEAAATLAVAAMALMAGQRWALGLVAVAQLLLLAALTSLLSATIDTVSLVFILASLGLLLPGLWSMRRAAATLVVLIQRRRTRVSCRRMYALLRISAAAAVVLPHVR